MKRCVPRARKFKRYLKMRYRVSCVELSKSIISLSGKLITRLTISVKFHELSVTVIYIKHSFLYYRGSVLSQRRCSLDSFESRPLDSFLKIPLRNLFNFHSSETFVSLPLHEISRRSWENGPPCTGAREIESA